MIKAIGQYVLSIILVFVIISGCAVQRSKAPQIDARTSFALNLETQVKQANQDYTTFFTDVGIAHRNGGLTDNDVTQLNNIGYQLRNTLNEADKLTKLYATNYDASISSQIGGLLSQVAADFAQLYAQRATALARTK